MSSSLIVDVCEIQEVSPHPNADRLELVTAKGWVVAAKKGEFKKGDKCVYFPPDTVLPGPLAREMGVDKYLAALPKNPDGSRPDGFRIRVARLRGERSYGLVIPCNEDWEVGTSVIEHYGVSKWEPPAKCTDGDAERPNPSFFKYTGIEHLQNFPGVLQEGEEVIITEKLHGKNSRMGLIREANENGDEELVFMVGSHGVRRKEKAVIKKVKKDENGDPLLDENGDIVTYEVERKSQFWELMTDNVKALLKSLSGEAGDEVIVYGEMIGEGVQDMQYGVKGITFRAFDIMFNGSFINYDNKKSACELHGVPMVPILYRGPWHDGLEKKFVDGPTTMAEPDVLKHQFKGREGIVITPAVEREDRCGRPGTGRVIFKCVSFDYLDRKGGTEDH